MRCQWSWLMLERPRFSTRRSNTTTTNSDSSMPTYLCIAVLYLQSASPPPTVKVACPPTCALQYCIFALHFPLRSILTVLSASFEEGHRKARGGMERSEGGILGISGHKITSRWLDCVQVHKAAVFYAVFSATPFNSAHSWMRYTPRCGMERMTCSPCCCPKKFPQEE
jgi:hypothetical protein